MGSSSPQRTRRFSGFVEWVLEESPHKAQLQTWFAKPKKEDVIQPPPKENVTYAQVPGELKRCNLLKSAERYYEKEEHRRRPSTWLVALLTVIFFIPASLVFLLRRAFRAIFPVSRSLIPPEITHTLNATLQPKPCPASSPPLPTTAERDDKTASTSHSPPLHDGEEAGAQSSERHVHHFDGPWSFARSWALYVVYILITRLQGMCSLMECICYGIDVAICSNGWIQGCLIAQSVSEVSQ